MAGGEDSSSESFTVSFALCMIIEKLVGSGEILFCMKAIASSVDARCGVERVNEVNVYLS